MFLSRVLTNAPPLPGLTCWKLRIVNRLPSTRMALPFLNWFVDIMPDNSPSIRLVAAIQPATYPAQTPRYYRINFGRVSRGRLCSPGPLRPPTIEDVSDGHPVAVRAHPGDDRIDDG